MRGVILAAVEAALFWWLALTHVVGWHLTWLLFVIAVAFTARLAMLSWVGVRERREGR